MYLVTSLGFKPDHRTRMLAIDLRLSRIQPLLVKNGTVGEWLIENHNEVIFKVFGHTPSILGRVTYYLLLLGDYLHVRAVVQRVNDDERAVIFRERETKHGRPFGRRYLGHHVMIRQVDAIVVRF